MNDAKLIFDDGKIFSGKSFGYESNTSGEVVFTTGMVGYPESLTDPSYSGQILVFTYPLIGNYGVSESVFWESKKIQVRGIVVCRYIDTPSHPTSKRTLGQWLIDEKIPGIEVLDTRLITQKLRDEGCRLGSITLNKNSDEIPLYNTNDHNLVSLVSTKEVVVEGSGAKRIVLIDCGAKKSISKNLVKRGIQVITVPWDYDIFAKENKYEFDGIMISNGPGDPKKVDKTILTIREAINRNIPIFGICLGNQILALAAGGDTYKLKFGHRSQNQPCKMIGSEKCYITTQNHGYAVGKIPNDFRKWFVNANDGTNEGIIHKSKPIMSVQFHPESYPGPQDTEWLFDYFIGKI